MSAIISVIVPVYKVEPYLRHCIDSILAQTFTNFELILVDDGSPDNCPAICDEYKRKDIRVEVIHKKNEGVSSARNAGMEIASGEYVTFVDGDDWIESSFLNKMVSSLLRQDADLAVCGYKMVDSNGNMVRSFAPEERVMSNIEALNYFGEIGNSCFRAPWNKIVKKNILNAFPFPLDRIYAEDFAVVYRWMFESHKIVSVGAELYCYVLSNSGIDRHYSSKWLQNFRTLDEVVHFFKKKKLKNLHKRYLVDTVYFGLECLNQNGINAKDSRVIKNIIRNVLLRYHYLAELRPYVVNEAWEKCFPHSNRLWINISLCYNKGIAYFILRFCRRLRRLLWRK